MEYPTSAAPLQPCHIGLSSFPFSAANNPVATPMLMAVSSVLYVGRTVSSCRLVTREHPHFHTGLAASKALGNSFWLRLSHLHDGVRHFVLQAILDAGDAVHHLSRHSESFDQ